MLTNTHTITTTTGRRFAVRVVRRGDRYGHEDCLTHDRDLALIEFYDLSYPETFGERGQFVTRYDADTLLGERAPHYKPSPWTKPQGVTGGLYLDCGVPEWTLDAAAMRDALAYAYGVLTGMPGGRDA